MSYIKSPINYAGNKFKTLDQILPHFPKDINNFVDLFGGSGTVSINVDAKNVVYNDNNGHIAEILLNIKHSTLDGILERIDMIISEYKLSKTNEHGYYKLREDYNNHNQYGWIHLYVLLCYAFNNQFRLNSKGMFNMPFGKNKSEFNSRLRENLIKTKQRFNEIEIGFNSFNFTEFNFTEIKKNDFVYLDPPYLNSVATYNENNGWNEDLENSLRDLLLDLNKKSIKWCLSNNLGVNTTLNDWIRQNNFNVIHIDRNYNNSSYQKKNKVVDEEVIILNY